jgi:hypothetical protein
MHLLRKQPILLFVNFKRVEVEKSGKRDFVVHPCHRHTHALHSSFSYAASNASSGE